MYIKFIILWVMAVLRWLISSRSSEKILADSPSSTEVSKSISNLDNENTNLSPNTGHRLFSNAAPHPTTTGQRSLKIGTEILKCIHYLQEKKNLSVYMNY